MKTELPKNWIFVNLKTVFDYQKGKKPKKLSEEQFEGSVPYLDIKAFEKNEIRRYADPESSNLIYPNQLGIVWDGARSGWLTKGQYGAVGSTIAILKPKLINENFGFHFLTSKFKYINSNTRGTGIPHVDPQILWNIAFPLPPIAEQERIVGKLESSFARLDKIKSSLKNLISIKEQYVYSCLVNPDNKEFYTRKRLAEFLQEGTERIGDEWINCRKVGVSAKKGIIDLSTGQKKTFEKYKVVRPGDFIYNTMRVNIGSIAIYNGVENAITSPDYVVFRVENHLSPELLLGFLKSDQGLLEIGANTKGSVRARLYFKSLSQIRMPVSDEKTQIMAEKFLHEFSKSIKKLKKLSKTHFDNLSQSILQEAFKGELVPQLESDGDSRELLREIEELKAGNILKKTSGRRKTIKDFGKEYALDQERQLKVEEGKETYKK